jgi:hypothetical protein
MKQKRRCKIGAILLSFDVNLTYLGLSAERLRYVHHTGILYTV